MAEVLYRVGEEDAPALAMHFLQPEAETEESSPPEHAWRSVVDVIQQHVRNMPSFQQNNIIYKVPYLSEPLRQTLATNLAELTPLPFADKLWEHIFSLVSESLRSLAPQFWAPLSKKPAAEPLTKKSKTEAEDFDALYLRYFNSLHSYLDSLERIILYMAEVMQSNASLLRVRLQETYTAILFTAPSYAPLLHRVLIHFFLKQFYLYNEEHQKQVEQEEEKEKEEQQEAEEALKSKRDGQAMDLDSSQHAHLHLHHHNHHLDLQPTKLLHPSSSLSSPSSSGSFNPSNLGALERFSLLLHQLHLLPLCEELFSEVLFGQIQARVKSECSGKYDTPVLRHIWHWVHGVVLKWLQSVVCPPALSHFPETNFASLDGLYQRWVNKLEVFVHEAFASLRIDELFDIIVEFPDSSPALLDLKHCLTKTNLHMHLVTSLRRAIVLRLLHPGANTSDIITQYISTIKALNLIDPSGVTLDLVSESVRKYLSNREDTIRCIVASCTEDTNSELFEELANSKPEQGNDTGVNESDNEDSDTEWQPDPIHADTSTRTHKQGDIIGTLVNIYGSTDLFVSEYRSMLADRLLAILDYDTEKELRILELLKLRFGEQAMQQCEIMIKDILESKRINNICALRTTRVAPSLSLPPSTPGFAPAPPLSPPFSDLQIDATVVSYLFWPTFREERLSLPTIIANKLEEYGKAYEALKASRKLAWKPHLGTVDVELSFDDGRDLSVSVSPVLATIIMAFQDQDTWKLKDLASSIGMVPEALRRRLTYWINLGVIKEIDKHTYKVIERAETSNISVMPAEDEESSATTADDEELNERVESLVLMMLRTHGGKAADSIHSSVCAFIDEYRGVLQNTVLFLNRMVKEDKLDYSGGMYSLRKS